MALFGETRQGFVVTGFGVVVFWRLVVDGVAGYGLLFDLPRHLAERDAQLGHTPTTRQKGSSLLGGIWNGVVVAMQHSYPPPPASRDRCSAEASTPPAGGRGVWLPTLQGWALPTPDSIPME